MWQLRGIERPAFCDFPFGAIVNRSFVRREATWNTNSSRCKTCPDGVEFRCVKIGFRAGAGKSANDQAKDVLEIEHFPDPDDEVASIIIYDFEVGTDLLDLGPESYSGSVYSSFSSAGSGDDAHWLVEFFHDEAKNDKAISVSLMGVTSEDLGGQDWQIFVDYD